VTRVRLYKALDIDGMLRFLRDGAIEPYVFQGGDSEISAGSVGSFWFRRPMTIGALHRNVIVATVAAKNTVDSVMTWAQRDLDERLVIYETPEVFVTTRVPAKDVEILATDKASRDIAMEWACEVEKELPLARDAAFFDMAGGWEALFLDLFPVEPYTGSGVFCTGVFVDEACCHIEDIEEFVALLREYARMSYPDPVDVGIYGLIGECSP